MSVTVSPRMGTIVGVDVRDAIDGDVIAEAVNAFFADLEAIEDRFSPWRPGSEISRIGRGELRPSDASPDVRWVLAACDELERATGGAFRAWRRDPGRPLDPSALVKGWAVDRAARRLVEAGLSNWCINAGGDVLARGAPGPDRRWRVGVRHPVFADRLGAVLEIDGGAVATSGLYERGPHIVDGRTGDLPQRFWSVTVIGPELGWADAYATAAFALGDEGLEWVHDHPAHGAVAMTADDRLITTPLARRHLTSFSGSSA